MKIQQIINTFKKFISSKKKLEFFLMLVRGLFYQITHFKFVGIILLGKSVEIKGMKNMKIKGVMKLDDYASIDARFCSILEIGNNFSLGKFSILRASGSDFQCPGIFIGSNVSFGPYCYIGGGCGLTIKDNCLFGPSIQIHPENHNFNDLSKPIREQGVNGVGIKIGSNCWIGARNTILDGAQVDNNVVFGALSLVTRGKYLNNSIYYGSPAKLKKVIHDN
jgi:acetyltransferase-like isoleucine patch superfamily enzyme